MTEETRKQAWTHWREGHPLLAKVPNVPQVIGSAFDSYEHALAAAPPAPERKPVAFGVGWTVVGNAALEAELPPDCQPAVRSVIWTLNTPMSTPFHFEQILFKDRVTALTVHLFGPLKQGFGLDIEFVETTLHDAKVRQLAEAVAKHPGRVLVRPLGEMAGFWNGYHASHAAAAFRKVVSIFREAGATNAEFAWCYCPSGPKIDYGLWYPGDDVVDWFALDVFEREHFDGDTERHAWVREFLDMPRGDGKPVIVWESSSVDVPMANAKWDDWLEPFLAFLRAHPEIRTWIYISHDWATYGGGAATWESGDLTHNPLILGRLVEEFTLNPDGWLHKHELEAPA